MNIQISQFKGTKPEQEDSYLSLASFPASSNILSVVGVLDGVSCTRLAHLAAVLAGIGFQQSIWKNTNTTDLRALMLRALEDTNTAVRMLHSWIPLSLTPDELPAATGTFALLSKDRELVIGWVGDTPALIRRGGTFFNLTKGHNDSDGHLERYLGQEDFKPEIVKGRLVENDELWLMTDGAYSAYLESDSTPEDFFSNATEELFWDNATALRLTVPFHTIRKTSLPARKESADQHRHIDLKA